MIQEKDFLYRVPVKTAPITTPGGQIRNPEILVDIEGGEFMHGNILDANSTNKLVNQSVKDAIDKNIADGGFVTKDLLDKEVDRATKKEDSLSALIQDETNARSSKDTELENSIAEEKTRAQGKEKEISDKLAIVDGDSNTEGSFRKAIADVIAAAPEDLDTLKEIADKLSGNDDLHTALNQAITEKADASALANEVTRATSAESDLQAVIDTKADAIALSNYVLTTALNQQVDTLNTAINAKQDAGNYIPYYEQLSDGKYRISGICVEGGTSGDSVVSDIGKIGLSVVKYTDARIYSKVQGAKIELQGDENRVRINDDGIDIWKRDNYAELGISYHLLGLSKRGIKLHDGDNNHVLTSNASTIDITQYALKTELPTVPTKTSQLTNDSNFMAANVVQDTYFGLEKSLRIYSEAANKIMNISHYDIRLETNSNDFTINENGFFVSRDSDGTYLCTFTPSGIKFEGKTASDIPTANGSFIDISNYTTRDFVTAALLAKQNKITVNTIDVTDIETADVTKLRTIVTDLINALISSGLIKATSGVE